jgi:hypothetical protein
VLGLLIHVVLGNRLMGDTTIQSLIDQAAPGDTVRVPPGRYEVDSVNAPITLRSGITLDLTGVTLAALPTDRIFSMVVAIPGCSDVTIVGGDIVGERDTHIGSTAWDMGGGGGGITIYNGSRNVKIRGTKVSNCFADGILLLHAHGVEVDGVVSNHNRRQGMSVVDVDGLHVHHSQFSDSGGTPPGSGIDIENDLETEAIRNVLVEHCVFYGNQGSGIGIGGPGVYENIVIAPTNSFDMKTQPIWVAGNAAPLGTSPWAFLLNRTCSWMPWYRWWGYRTDWYRA